MLVANNTHNDDDIYGSVMWRQQLRERKWEYLKWHGWMMWLSWGIFGYVMIASQRYLRHKWKLAIWLHSTCGTACFLINIIYGVGAIQ